MTSPTYQILSAYGLSPESIAVAVTNQPIAYADSFLCRDAVKDLPAEAAVIVFNRAIQAAIAPINLAAAMCLDNPRRDVYLWEDEPSGSLVSRARAAGIRGVIDSQQMGQLLEALTQRTPGSQQDDLESCGLDEPEDWHQLQASAGPAFPPQAPVAPPAPLKPQVPQTPQYTPAPPAPPAPPAASGSVIGVFSGRGGVGKSTVTLMLALMAAERGLRVAVIDADLQFGDIAYLLGTDPKQQASAVPLLDVLNDDAKLANAGPLLVLTAPDNVEQSELLSEAMPSIISRAAQCYQLVLVNTSAYWTVSQAQLAKACSRLLFLMDQRATSVKACQRVVDLCIRLQIPEARFCYAINGCHRLAPISPQDASLALGGSQVVGLEDGGSLVDELLSLGAPWELLDSGNAFVRSLARLLDQMLPRGFGPQGQAAGPAAGSADATARGLFKNLFKRGQRDVA